MWFQGDDQGLAGTSLVRNSTRRFICRRTHSGTVSFYNKYFTFEYPALFGMEFHGRLQVLGMRMASEWTQYNYFVQNQHIQIMKTIINLADKDPYIAATKAEREIQEASALWGPRYVLNAILLPALARVYSSYVRGLAEATTARTALASLLYREDYGRMPESLDVLTPEYLPVPPRDPFTPDGILGYKVTDTQAIFYSVGLDQDDDGGTAPEKSILQDGDILFRVPVMQTLRPESSVTETSSDHQANTNTAT